ncbi:MAG: hypothetical protein A2Z08_08005 [Deltaproteobacteria bacterium RBG_16_54_11]|nr:MAG: hypothetical protein A2Z08_08005 [Deltaproteobacteria bacterium RBG_16_54_11]
MAYDDLKKEIIDTQYATLKTQRKNLLEDQMQASFDAFKGKYDSDQLTKWTASEMTKWRSKVFVRATKMKVVSAVASIEDIVLQGGSLPWDIHPTAQPQTTMPFLLDEKTIEKRCENMRKKIKDTIQETNAVRPFTNSITEQAIYGWSWLKFPVLKKYERIKFTAKLPQVPFIYPDMDLAEYMRYFPSVEKFWLPSMSHPSVWDVFWDLEDFDPQGGQAIIQRIPVTPGMLRAITEEKPAFYDKAAVNTVIDKFKDASGAKEGVNPYLKDLTELKRGIEIIEYSGRVDKSLLKKAGVETSDRQGNEREILCALAGAGGEYFMIRPPKENRLPMKRRPLWISRWEYGVHEPGGIGIPENMKDAQQMINSAYRRLIDNKSLAGNLMLAGKSSNLAPGVSPNPSPGKWIELAEHVQDVRSALQWFSPPDISDGLIDLINLAERFADEEANLPKILQGETAQYQPKTAFEMAQLLKSANKTLSKVIRNKDSEHIEPYIQSLYVYFMIADTDENIKGDYACHATGFNSFMDKQVRATSLLNLLTFALANKITAFMTEIPALYREVFKTQDAERFVKSKDKIDEQGDMLLQMLTANAQVQAGVMQPGEGAL